MYKKNLILLCVIASTISLLGMDANTNNTISNVVPFNNGLLTKIPAIIKVSDYKWTSFFSAKYVETKTIRVSQNTILLRLICSPRKTSGKIFGHAPGTFLIEHGAPIFPICEYEELFDPIIYDVSNEILEKRNFWNGDERYICKEAIRQGNGIYCTSGQGAIIYSLDTQPDFNLCKQIEEELKLLSKK